LILAQLCLDGNRYSIFFNLAAIEELGKKLTFIIPSFQELLRKTRRIGKTGLE
jgi:hypothetical protein